MKRIFTYSLPILLFTVFLGACSRQSGDIDESYWLNKERGVVVYSDPYCSYYVVETNNGYSILRAYGGNKPYEGTILYGDFSYYGSSQFYSRSSGYLYSAEVKDYWLTYYDAQYAIEYYCF